MTVKEHVFDNERNSLLPVASKSEELVGFDMQVNEFHLDISFGSWLPHKGPVALRRHLSVVLPLS